VQSIAQKGGHAGKNAVAAAVPEIQEMLNHHDDRSMADQKQIQTKGKEVLLLADPKGEHQVLFYLCSFLSYAVFQECFMITHAH